MFGELEEVYMECIILLDRTKTSGGDSRRSHRTIKSYKSILIPNFRGNL